MIMNIIQKNDSIQNKHIILVMECLIVLYLQTQLVSIVVVAVCSQNVCRILIMGDHSVCPMAEVVMLASVYR